MSANVEVIQPDTEEGREVYGLLEELRAAYHPHLAEAKIVLAWRRGWRPTREGLLKLAKARKVGPLDKQLHGFDFVIELNDEVWHEADFSREQKAALLDHELCHCSVKLDDYGEPETTDDGRPAWCIRKHDVEEFSEVVARHGLWRYELERFARAALEAQKRKDKTPKLLGQEDQEGEEG